MGDAALGVLTVQPLLPAAATRSGNQTFRRRMEARLRRERDAQLRRRGRLRRHGAIM